MKDMKVVWATASSFTIVACLLTVGCSSSRHSPSQTRSTGTISHKPAPPPVFGKPMIAGQENSPHLALMVSVTNRTTEKVKASIEIKGAPSEVLHRVSGLGSGQGTTVFTVCQITRNRTKPIVVKVKWRRGVDTGISNFTVSPKQSDIIRS
jgi:hypothetical protein